MLAFQSGSVDHAAQVRFPALGLSRILTVLSLIRLTPLLLSRPSRKVPESRALSYHQSLSASGTSNQMAIRRARIQFLLVEQYHPGNMIGYAKLCTLTAQLMKCAVA